MIHFGAFIHSFPKFFSILSKNQKARCRISSSYKYFKRIAHQMPRRNKALLRARFDRPGARQIGRHFRPVRSFISATALRCATPVARPQRHAAPRTGNEIFSCLSAKTRRFTSRTACQHVRVRNFYFLKRTRKRKNQTSCLTLKKGALAHGLGESFNGS